jgi:hypothetical protein
VCLWLRQAQQIARGKQAQAATSPLKRLFLSPDPTDRLALSPVFMRVSVRSVARLLGNLKKRTPGTLPVRLAPKRLRGRYHLRGKLNFKLFSDIPPSNEKARQDSPRIGGNRRALDGNIPIRAWLRHTVVPSRGALGMVHPRPRYVRHICGPASRNTTAANFAPEPVRISDSRNALLGDSP